MEPAEGGGLRLHPVAVNPVQLAVARPWNLRTEAHLRKGSRPQLPWYNVLVFPKSREVPGSHERSKAHGLDELVTSSNTAEEKEYIEADISWQYRVCTCIMVGRVGVQTILDRHVMLHTTTNARRPRAHTHIHSNHSHFGFRS